MPLTLILNCGGTSPRLLYYKHDRLKCKELRIKTFQIKRLWLKMITDIRKEFSVNFVVPSAVSRYVNTFTKFFMEASEFERSWPDSDIDSVMQVFIPPKGLVVAKTRVVLRSDSIRVFVISNKARVDGIEENDLIKHREQSKKVKVKQHHDDVLYKEIQPTLLKRSQILRKLKESTPLHSSSFIEPAPGLVKVYDLFRHDFSSTDLQVKEIKKRPIVKRFTAHCDSSTSSIYEVSSNKYTDLITLAEQLRRHINRHILVQDRAKDIVVDFIQGCDGMWYFINLKYLGLVTRKRSTVNVSVVKAMPVTLDCNGDYCKMTRGALKASFQHIIHSAEVSQLLLNRRLNHSSILRSEIHRHRAALRLKTAYNCSYKLMGEAVSICSLCARFYQDAKFLFKFSRRDY